MASAEGQAAASKVRKQFIPLENNPEVMSSLLYNLGMSRALAFHDVFSIDSPDLLAILPRPVYALLLVFPVSDAYEKARVSEDGSKEDYSGSGSEEKVMWFKQTIGNACGLIGLLHAAANGVPGEHLEPASALHELLRSAVPLLPGPRAELLESSPNLEAAHETAAKAGDTEAPAADTNIDLHYVCFVKGTDGHLYELDGRRKGPLDRGPVKDGDDVLAEEVLERSVRRFMKVEQDNGGEEMRFSLIALAPADD
ncbi:MAG: hypothetical protein M1814_000202 [Vezdaea aestivalis]|nr:MAG: hypothetical protein M1814_000202 [Vezdaea aestivalis]